MSVNKTNYTTGWIVIYLVDSNSINHLANSLLPTK